MRKVILLCSAGMSTSLLVTKMKDAANTQGLQYDISAHSVSDAQLHRDADIILLGPQVRFQLERVKEDCPNVVVDVIDMQVYGRIDGAAVVEKVKEIIGE